MTTCKTSKEHIQFSKIIVIAVTSAVTAIALISILLMWSNGNVQYMADIIKSYISYAMVVFVSYSGNSAVEKWLIHRGPTIALGDTIIEDTSNTEEMSDDANG